MSRKMTVVYIVLLYLGYTNAKPTNERVVSSANYGYYEEYNARVGPSTPVPSNKLGIFVPSQKRNGYENFNNNPYNPALGNDKSRGFMPDYGNSQNPTLGSSNQKTPILGYGNPFSDRADYNNVPNPETQFGNGGSGSTGNYRDRVDYSEVNIGNGIGKTNNVLLLEGHGIDPDYIYATSQDRNQEERNFIHAVIPNTGKTRITNIGHGFGNNNNVVVTSNTDTSYSLNRKPEGFNVDLYNKKSNGDNGVHTVTTGQGKSNKSFFSFLGF